jgi:putative phage-type endonuclease
MLKEIKLEQGSDEWLNFRMLHRMASETPILMGLSSYQTLDELRSIKLGKRTKVNDAMRNGQEQEIVARDLYSQFYEPMRPAVFVDREYGCSVDGINIDGDVLLEIKTPYYNCRTSERWILAEQNKTTAADYAQIQHQLMVTGAQYCDLMIFDYKTEDYILVKVMPDVMFWKNIKAAWDSFWPSIQSSQEGHLIVAAEAYKLAQQKHEEAQARLEEAKALLLSLVSNDHFYGGGVEVKKLERKGVIDWKAVQEQHLLGVDVEPFRKTPSTYFDIRIVKAKT